MYVGVCKLTLLIPGSHSLKEKRAVVRRIKDRVAQRFHLGLAEVGGLDTWQRAVLGLAVVSSDRDHANETLDGVVRFVQSLGQADGLAELAAERRDVFAYGDDDAGWRGAAGQGDADAALAQIAAAGGSDKAAAADGDQSWVPAAWLDDELGSKS